MIARLATSRNSLISLSLLDLAGFGMLIPDVQLRAEHLGARGWLIGVILSSTFVIQACTSPFWGHLSDRFGRKPIVVICTLLSALAGFVYMGATSVWVILVSRILAGLGAANIAAAQAALADSSDPEERSAVMGKIGAAVSAGLIAGPALGGILIAAGGPTLLGFVAGSCSLLGACSAWAFFKGPVVAPSEHPDKRASAWSVLTSIPALMKLFAIAAIGWLALACLEGTFGRLLEFQLNQGQLAFGLIFGYESLVAVAVQGWGVKPAVSRFGERRVLEVAFVLQGLGLAAMPFAPSMAIMVVAATVYSCGSALLGPSINGLASRITPPERQGAMFGLLQSARSLGFMVGPTLGGMMFDWRPSAPYLMAGAVCLVAAGCAAVSLRKTWVMSNA